MSAPRYEGIFPGMKYRDAPAAIDFLQRAFGFEPLLVVPGEEGSVVHSQLWAGDFCISAATATAGDTLGRITPAQAGGVTQMLYFVVDDVDAHYERAKAAGAEIVSPLEARDYGGKDYSCRDPEGHLWSFGTYRPTRDS
jgi:uncharacterized glyoxalase superfamily protein PhnB